VARLAVARGEHIERIYRESHALWGGGLSFRDYLAFWRELASTPWAREHVVYQVWLGPREELLSSFKLYRPRVRILGRPARACVIGAVFTPRAHRGRGHATAMIRAALAQAAERGDPIAMLFSDIGTRLYSALGFVPLPAEETWGRLGRHGAPGPAGWRVRDVERRDMETVRRMHDAWCADRPLVFLRETGHWDFVQARTQGFFARLGDGRLIPAFRIVEQHGRPRGYLVTVEGRGELSLREVGAEGGDPELMAQIARTALHLARARGLRRVYGWLPPNVADRLADWRLQRRPRQRAIPMALEFEPVRGAPWLRSADAAFIPYQDQF